MGSLGHPSSRDAKSWTILELLMSNAYDRRQSYAWNYDHVPAVPDVEARSHGIPPVPGEYSLAGRALSSPLGVAAGPLLNGRWCLYYAALGFDLVTYKTVRSEFREAHAMPNLQPVARREPLLDSGQTVIATDEDASSWAVSFGMPSQDPATWQADVRATRKGLSPSQQLSVSVVGSRAASLAELAEDYALCAKMAVDSGADFIEANFSCPNVTTCDGQLFQSPSDAGQVASRIHQAIHPTPLLIKVGYLPTQQQAVRTVDALAPFVDAIVTTNGMTAKVSRPGGDLMFAGYSRGICGDIIREASLLQVERFRHAIDRSGSSMEIVGVGGIRTYQHVRSYMNAGASVVQLATAVMLDPLVGLKIREEWGG